MDQLLRGLDADKAVRVVAAVTTDVVRDGAKRHNLFGASAALLGRGLTAASLLTTLTKNENERVRIAMRADGPLGRVLVDAHGDGRVRGCYTSERVSKLRLTIEPGRAALGRFVGKGQLRVTRDVGLEHPYEGVVELTSGEFDEDLEHYLTESEQLPSVLRCHVVLDSNGEVVRAAGILAQTFPGSGPELLEPTRAAIAGEGLAQLLASDRSATELMGFAVGGRDFTPLAPSPLTFACDCGPQRARSIVSTLGADDIDTLADEQEGTEVRCSYCGNSYALSGADLRELATELRQRQS